MVHGPPIDSASLVRSPGLDFHVADLEPVHVLGLEGPVGRVLQEEVLHQQVGRVLRLEEVGPILLPHQEADAGDAPPPLAVAVLGCISVDIFLSHVMFDVWRLVSICISIVLKMSQNKFKLCIQIP